MGFWSKLGKAALIGGAGVATAFTGGAASPLLAAAVGAGTGAATGALNGGGWKGALLGAGLGAATGGIAGGAGGAAGGAAGSAGASTAANVAKGAILTKAGLGAAGALLGNGGTPVASNGKGIDWSQVANTGLGIAGALAQGRQGQRETDTGNIIARDNQGLAAQAQNQNAQAQAAQIQMQQKEAERAALNNAYKNALQSSLALNMRDASFNRPDGVPTISLSGGARPSAIGAQGKQAAALMNAKALEALLNPDKLTPLTPPGAYQLTDLPKSNGLDTALGTAGVVGKVLEANQARADAAKQSDLIAQLIANNQATVAAPAATPATFMPATSTGTGFDWSKVRF